MIWTFARYALAAEQIWYIIFRKENRTWFIGYHIQSEDIPEESDEVRTWRCLS